ncbi:hypothetical protein [Shimia sp.]|uniref:hypothetical protein n=1 Tax=Shimia sp. TaxID=1954381 RepID=UPI003BA92E80
MTEPKHGWNAFRPYAQGDLGRVWDTLLGDELRELQDGGMRNPEALEGELLALGTKMIVWDTEDGAVAVYGVTPTPDPEVGLIWALPGSKAHKRWRWGVKTTEDAIVELGRDYSVLMNLKDARNTKQITWLKKIGFTFINRLQGENGQTYLEFVRIMK